ncbi:ABC transporter permease [Petroclostridium xylanilyticum]|uniref:ABC transporter permease n=1 Tax=Petroclostridium xylanilyticum TaxID=1792311 RepID=UPI0012FF84A6|nr:ABC transporter permease [Petroclostridium xylanilyticum]
MFFLKTLLKDIKTTFIDFDVIVLLLGAPIFLTLLFGGIYVNPYIEDIPIAVLDEDNSSMSRMIIQQFDENDRFHVKYNVNSKEELHKLIDTKKVYMGLYLPHEFSKNVNTLRSAEVLVIVDGTNMIIGNNAYAAAAGIIQTISAGVQMKLLEAKGVMPQTAQAMAMVFNFNDRTLYDPRLTYMNYLILGFVAVFLQQIMLSGIGISVIKHGADIAVKNTFTRLIAKILSCCCFGLISTFAAVAIVSNVFKVPIRGNLSIALLLCSIFVFAISCPALILAALTKDKLKFAQVSFMLSLPTFVSCGYVWPQEQMPKILVTIIKILWPLINFARPFDELLFKGVSFNTVRTNMLEMVIYTLAWFPVAFWLVKKRFKSKTI